MTKQQPSTAPPSSPDTGNSLAQALQAAHACHSKGQLLKAQALYQNILVAQPKHAPALHLLGVLLLQQGQPQLAAPLLEDAVGLEQANAVFHGHLALALGELQQIEPAIASYRRALELNSQMADVHYNLANLLQANAKGESALLHYRSALAIKPDYADAQRNLGNCLMGLGQYQAAENCFTALVASHPENANDLYNLGNTLRMQGKLPEARQALQRALAVQPQASHILNNLGTIFKEEGDLANAVATFQQVLANEPRHWRALNNLGEAFKAQQKLDDAINCYRAALEVQPVAADVLSNLADALKDAGQIGPALVAFQSALALNPSLAYVHSNYLLCSQYSAALSEADRVEAHMAFGRQFADRSDAGVAIHTHNHEPNRRIKIGYVSPDFRDHPVASFILPVLCNHSKADFEIYCYYNHQVRDVTTSKFADSADHWRDVHALSDAELSTMIRSDGIDILVDLAGHTARNRLLVFASKPAPVQVSYLGYVATTGLNAMTYRLTDMDTDQPTAQACYSERLLRLAHPLWWCYRPPVGMPPVAPAPSLRNGFITFGSTNNFAKLSPQTLGLWIEVLHAVPTAELVIVGVPAGSAEAALRQQFRAHAIDNSRIKIHGKLSREKFWALHSQIDIVFDTTPYNGGTTTCDALWLGVPCITMAGTTFVSRMGQAILKSIGLPELIGVDAKEYVTIAKAVAGKVNYLDDLRATMRERLLASPLFDEVGFTQKLESAYREIWRHTCITNA